MANSVLGGYPAGLDGLGATDVPVTPDRGSLLRLDVPTYVFVEPPAGITRLAAEMSRSAEALGASSKVILLEADGWQIEPLQNYLGYAHERQETASSVLPFSVPSGFHSFNVFRSPTDQPGATTGASPNISTTGDQFYGKKVGGGTNWDDAAYHNAADEVAMPTPDTGDDTLVMDRIGVALGGIGPNDGFFIRFRIQGGKITAADKALIEMFNGPAGVDRTFMGYGYYAVFLNGDGTMLLYERGEVAGDATHTGVWRKRHTMRFCPPGVNITGTHRVFVRPVVLKTIRGNTSGHIYFFHEGSDRVSAGGAKTRFDGTNGLSLATVYSAPATGKTAPATRIQPHRYNQRRGERHHIQVQKAVYFNQGVLRCDAFAVDSYILSTKPLRLYWWGDIPPGCSIDGKFYDATTDTETELTPEGTSGDLYDASGNKVGGYKYYTVTYPARQFYPKFFLNGNGDLNGGNQSSKTPILGRYQMVKDGRVEDLVPTETTSKVTQFSMTGQDSDPSHETGGGTVKDIGNNLVVLTRRGSIPFILQTCYDKADRTKVSRLMQGWVQKAVASRRGVRFPVFSGQATNWKSIDLQCIGEWARLAIARMPFRWDFADPQDLGAPPKVTNVLRQGFAFAGYIAQQLDIPDLPTRMFTGADAPEMFLDPLADVSACLCHLAMDYLGCWICWDPNAAVVGSGVDRGVWRVRPQNLPDANGNYNCLAHFHTDSATDANKLKAMAPVHSLKAYPIETVSGQAVQHSYVRRKTLDTWVRAPEANIISVTGTGTKLFGQGRDAETALTVTLPNSKSFNFAGFASSDPKYPDRLNPDYLGYIAPYTFTDRSLRDIAGVQYVARRIYDRLCHGSKCVVFEAPLILVTDSKDALQVRPRPLRFYDAVKVDGIVFFVKNVTIAYVKDRVQMAVYELELPNGTLY